MIGGLPPLPVSIAPPPPLLLVERAAPPAPLLLVERASPPAPPTPVEVGGWAPPVPAAVPVVAAGSSPPEHAAQGAAQASKGIRKRSFDRMAGDDGARGARSPSSASVEKCG